jgi:hypothetical protein
VSGYLSRGEMFPQCEWQVKQKSSSPIAFEQELSKLDLAFEGVALVSGLRRRVLERELGVTRFLDFDDHGDSSRAATHGKRRSDVLA